MENISGIYQIKCVSSGKVYTGSATFLRSRINSHKRKLRRNEHFNSHLQNSFNKHGEKDFEFDVVELCPIEVLIERETIWNNLVPENLRFNLRIIAESNRGIKWDEEKRKRRVLTEEHKAALLDGWKKKPPSRESRILNGIAHRKPVAQIDLITGNTIATFSSQIEAALILGIGQRNISNVCNKSTYTKDGRIYTPKSAGGFGWRFVT